MCGIAGVLLVDGGSATGGLEAMVEAMRHRGPDDRGAAWFRSPRCAVGLGSSRLAIQDLSPAGHMPMVDPTTGNAIVFNGEIYNFHALRTELSSRGCRFQSMSDTEVALTAYREWGCGAFARFRGMFALAIWDQRAGKVILARDRFGVKPLYHASFPGGVAFASELRALLASGFLSPRLEPAAVAGYLAYGVVPEPLTMVSGARMLPQASHAELDGDSPRVQQYWSLPTVFAGSKATMRPADAAGEVRRLLEESVRLRLVSDAPLGIFLSGGLDSSTTAVLAATLSPDPVRTVSVVFPDSELSEKPVIDQMVAQLGTVHHEESVSHAQALDLAREAVDAMDQPTFDGVNTYIVSRAARQAGLKVALSGIGGDEVFGGYPSFGRLPGLVRFQRMVPRPIRWAGSHALERVSGDVRAARLAGWMRAPNSTAPEELMRRLFTDPELDGLVITPGRTASRDPWLPAAEDTFDRMSHYEIDVYLRNVLLRDTDVMSMANSLEVREPLLDHELVGFVAGLPTSLKRSPAVSKPLLAAAVDDLVPEVVRRRPKQGFALPFDAWLRGDLGREVGARLLAADFGGPLADHLDPARVQGVWDHYQRGRLPWLRPWSLYVLKAWCQRWL